MSLVDRFGFTGKTAVVTGGSKGIGAAICNSFAEAGAMVIVADIDHEAGDELAQRIGGKFVALDVTDNAACKSLAANAKADIVVANAGIVHNVSSVDAETNDFQSVLDVNLNGVFNTLQAFGSTMLEQGHGAVVCTSSICGEVTVWPQPQAAYNAAKAGVNLLVKSTAVEWAKSGVRVNGVAPGYTATKLTLAGRSKPEWFDVWMDRTPMGRLGEPREIADATLFLASDAASFITGTILNVDGGYTAA